MINLQTERLLCQTYFFRKIFIKLNYLQQEEIW